LFDDEFIYIAKCRTFDVDMEYHGVEQVRKPLDCDDDCTVKAGVMFEYSGVRVYKYSCTTIDVYSFEFVNAIPLNTKRACDHAALSPLKSCDRNPCP